MYNNHILHYKDTLSTAKSSYYAVLISSDEGNTRALFSTVKNILRPPDSLAPHQYSTAYCNSLMSFFYDKIENIHQQLTPNTTCSISLPVFTDPLSHSLSSFTLPSAVVISDLIIKSKPSTCQLDPLPTPLVKACLPSLSALITVIIHSSLTSGLVPSLFKSANLVQTPTTLITFVPYLTYHFSKDCCIPDPYPLV